MLLPLFVKSLWSFFFDKIPFGFVVVFIYKTVNHKIAQVNTPLHLIWPYINGKLNSIYTQAIYCRVQSSIRLLNNSSIQDYNHSINIRFFINNYVCHSCTLPM